MQREPKYPRSAIVRGKTRNQDPNLDHAGDEHQKARLIVRAPRQMQSCTRQAEVQILIIGHLSTNRKEEVRAADSRQLEQVLFL